MSMSIYWRSSDRFSHTLEVTKHTLRGKVHYRASLSTYEGDSVDPISGVSGVLEAVVRRLAVKTQLGFDPKFLTHGNFRHPNGVTSTAARLVGADGTDCLLALAKEIPLHFPQERVRAALGMPEAA